jgi:hypothetical protein
MYGHQVFAINGDLLLTFDAEKYQPKTPTVKAYKLADFVKPTEVYKLIGFKTDISNFNLMRVILIENQPSNPNQDRLTVL